MTVTWTRRAATRVSDGERDGRSARGRERRRRPRDARTSEPRRFHTEPISRPITPPPMTAILFGTSLMSSAPVESTILPPALSTVAIGSFEGSEPVAMTMFFVASVSFVSPVTSTEFAPVILPLPFL